MEKYDLYQGVIVPMVTPLTKDGKIDEPSAVGLINFLLDNETTPFILGTTGEAASIPLRERETLVRLLVEQRREGHPVIAGVIGLTFSETVEQANNYINSGVDSVVITLPYHYELTDDQIYNYYNLLSESIEGDLIIYNIPKTVHQSIPVNIIDRLSHKKNIIGIKDSEPDIERLEHSLRLWADRKDFFHIVGVNALMQKGIELGSRGMVPSTANFVPALYIKLYNHCREGEMEAAAVIYRQTSTWSELYQDGRTLGESIAALKVIMSGMDLCAPYVMLPIIELDENEKERLLKIVKEEMKYYLR